jgi:hypothetical protein
MVHLKRGFYNQKKAISPKIKFVELESFGYEENRFCFRLFLRA